MITSALLQGSVANHTHTTPQAILFLRKTLRMGKFLFNRYYVVWRPSLLNLTVYLGILQQLAKHFSITCESISHQRILKMT